MNIRYYRDVHLLFNLRKSLRRFHRRHRAPDNLTACILQP
jgi:hypothetical protein